MKKVLPQLKRFEVWFIVGSQHLYGKEVLIQVEKNAKVIAKSLAADRSIPVSIVFKKVLTSSAEIYKQIKEANANDKCIGLIAWMHTFSPAKMWINGLKILHKPLLHLHTQLNAEIPWRSIDMNFMNINQSAHGGREFGFICTRLNIRRKVVAGHWQDEEVINKIAVWSRAAVGFADSQQMKVARLGDNMRQVAVTEGNKVSAQIQFGYEVNGYGLGDLNKHIQSIKAKEIKALVDRYQKDYLRNPVLKKTDKKYDAIKEAAKIELGLRHFLKEGKFTALTDTFENLHGLTQLPGIAIQRLMKDGYGFGAEGDWKIAALVRTMKVMASGLRGGNSFMEDYTYHFDEDGKVLGAHMLEICPSIAKSKPSCEIHSLGIGGKSPPVRLVFDVKAGPAINVTIIDLGDKFKMIVNKVEVIDPPKKLPKLPVARALWQPLPDLKTASAEWIKLGGAHHTCFSQNLSVEHMQDFADMCGIEMVTIG